MRVNCWFLNSLRSVHIFNSWQGCCCVGGNVCFSPKEEVEINWLMMLVAQPLETSNISSVWPQIRQGYLLNLSISISRGKETNRDCLSSGERSGRSPNLKSMP